MNSVLKCIIFFVIFILFGLLSIDLYYFEVYKYLAKAPDLTIRNLKLVEAYLNIREKLYIVFFAALATVLTLWARATAHEQLVLSREQLVLSRVTGQNERFSQAVAVFGKKENTESVIGALHILGDLISENPKANFIRCMDVLCNWLRAASHVDKENEDNLVPREIIQIACNILTQKVQREQSDIANQYIKKYKIVQWPDMRMIDFSEMNLAGAYLNTANLFGANFTNANIQEANLGQAELSWVNFDNANITKTEMMSAIGLQKNQIIFAIWYDENPKLPSDLMEDKDVKRWLEIEEGSRAGR